MSRRRKLSHVLCIANHNVDYYDTITDVRLPILLIRQLSKSMMIGFEYLKVFRDANR
jgi:hypothetical protein